MMMKKLRAVARLKKINKLPAEVVVPDELESAKGIETPLPEDAAKSYGTSKKLGISADIEVPIIKTGKPEVTVVQHNSKSPEPKAAGTNRIVLGSSEEGVIAWNIDKSEHTLLITSPETDVTEAFQNIAAYAATAHAVSNETIDYYGFDLNGVMFGDKTEVYKHRLAQNQHEAWDLSVALVNEIKNREASEEKSANRVLVLISDGNKQLINISSEQKNAHRHMELLSNINFILEHGAAVGVTVLMEVDAYTAEKHSRHNFNDVIILK